MQTCDAIEEAGRRGEAIAGSQSRNAYTLAQGRAFLVEEEGCVQACKLSLF